MPTTAPTTHARLRDRRFLAEQLAMIADLMELTGSGEADVEGHRQAAALLRQSPDAGALPTEPELAALEALGAGVFTDVAQLLRTGESGALAQLRAAIPAGVMAMLPLHGLGPKRLRIVWQEMGITHPAQLFQAVTENRLLRTRGFGPKTQAKVQQSLLQQRLNAPRFLLRDLRPLVTVLEQELRELLGEEARVDVAGEYRRGCTTCADITLLVHADHYKQVMVHLVQSPGYELMTAGANLLVARIRDTRIPLVFHFCAYNYDLELFRLSGSAEHVALIPVKAGRHYRSEAEVYAEAGLPYLPAALREGSDEVRLAMRKAVPKLVHHTDIQGLLHAHSDYSDGSDSLERMALHCQAMGMQYLGISDHGPGHPHGAGMRPEDIRAQHREIDRLNARLHPFRILKGIELDIRPDGSLPLPDAELAAFDFVIAALHVEEELNVAEATMRLVRAARNPYVTMLGHVTGRLMWSDIAQPTNVELLLDVCAEQGVAVEINCSPARMDLDWEAVRMAAARKVMVSISPNAHSAPALHDYENGIAVARKGLLTPSLTLNALPLGEIEDYLMARRRLRIG